MATCKRVGCDKDVAPSRRNPRLYCSRRCKNRVHYLKRRRGLRIGKKARDYLAAFDAYLKDPTPENFERRIEALNRFLGGLK